MMFLVTDRLTQDGVWCRILSKMDRNTVNCGLDEYDQVTDTFRSSLRVCEQENRKRYPL